MIERLVSSLIRWINVYESLTGADNYLTIRVSQIVGLGSGPDWRTLEWLHRTLRPLAELGMEDWATGRGDNLIRTIGRASPSPDLELDCAPMLDT